MIINLAGFRVGIFAVSPKEEIPLRAHLLNRQTCLPAQFHLRVHFTNRPLFNLEAGALLVNSSNSGKADPNQPTWKIQRKGSRINIQGWSQLDQSTSDWEMILDLVLSSGVLRHSAQSRITDALFFPIDQILIYYLAIWNQGVILHASVVSFGKDGYCFLGRSGMGKSTLARWCQEAGAEIIHDDKVVFKVVHGRVEVHSIPWGQYEIVSQANLSCGFTLEHADKLTFRPWDESEAVDQIIEHMVFYPVDHEVIQRQFQTILAISRMIPFVHMKFPNHASIISKIKSIMSLNLSHEK